MLVIAALFALTALAWAYLFYFSANMAMPHPMSMPGMDVPAMVGMGTAAAPFAREIFFAFAMWAVMMVGMMTPSVAPMILLYARVGRQAASAGKPFAPAAIFALGYLSAWTFVALVAAAIQILLARAALLSPMLVSTSSVLSGLLLVAAGIYQWSPAKNLCLAQCRSPLLFVQQHGGFRGSVAGGLSLGVKHGLYCVGCCWALMTLLFVGGVMNLVFIAGLAILVLLEKVLPQGRFFARAVGLVLIVAGLAFLVRTAWIW